MPPKKKQQSASPTRQLKLEPATASKAVIDIPDDDGTPAPAASSHKEEESDKQDKGKQPAIMPSNASDAGSYDGEFADFFDPALMDEEEVPHAEEHLPGSSTSHNGEKPKFAGGYNAMKTFNGQMYSGMAVGASHTWNYQEGIWKETKKEPDLWEIDYQTNKVRNHKAPQGSGAPVGTEYHWYIVAHQMVKKIDANTYETHLVGSKYKLTHKNVNAKNWDIPTVKGQRDREVALLDDAKRRVEGLPPVLSNEKVKVDKKEKGQATLANFFGSSGATPKKRKMEDEGNSTGMQSNKKVANGK